jgi:hypothetical protein
MWSSVYRCQWQVFLNASDIIGMKVETMFQIQVKDIHAKYLNDCDREGQFKAQS